MKSVYLSLPGIIDELRVLGKAKATGSFFIVSDEQHSAIVGFESGRIVSLQCRLRFGEKAIPLIAGIRNGTCRFEQTATFVRRVDFADNEEVFRRIYSAREPDDDDAGRDSAADSGVPKAKVAVEQPALRLSDKQKMDIENILVEELGPMGSIVLDSIENCTDIPGIMEVIRSEVDSPDIVSSVVKKITNVLRQ